MVLKLDANAHAGSPPQHPNVYGKNFIISFNSLLENFAKVP
jgi:hypothetical protein